MMCLILIIFIIFMISAQENRLSMSKQWQDVKNDFF